MATQGILSIVNKDGETLVKVICGCDGYNVVPLAEFLKKCPTADIDEVYALAKYFDVGNPDCLFVMTKDKIKNAILGDEYPHDRYRDTFHDPRFNPRWDIGTADYVEIVILE